MNNTMRKIMWGFREREPLKSVVIHEVGYTCLIFANTSPIARFALFLYPVAKRLKVLIPGWTIQCVKLCGGLGRGNLSKVLSYMGSVWQGVPRAHMHSRTPPSRTMSLKTVSRSPYRHVIRGELHVLRILALRQYCGHWILWIHQYNTYYSMCDTFKKQVSHQYPWILQHPCASREEA